MQSIQSTQSVTLNEYGRMLEDACLDGPVGKTLRTDAQFEFGMLHGVGGELTKAKTAL